MTEFSQLADRFGLFAAMFIVALVVIYRQFSERIKWWETREAKLEAKVEKAETSNERLIETTGRVTHTMEELATEFRGRRATDEELARRVGNIEQVVRQVNGNLLDVLDNQQVLARAVGEDGPRQIRRGRRAGEIGRDDGLGEDRR